MYMPEGGDKHENLEPCHLHEVLASNRTEECPNIPSKVKDKLLCLVSVNSEGENV